MRSEIKPLNLSNIRLIYQPQYDSRTNKIIGFEALARLQEDHQILSPIHFMDRIENENKIRLFTQIVLIRFINDYHKYFINLDNNIRFSINLDPNMIIEPTIINNLHKISKHEFFHTIVLEITEKKLTNGSTESFIANIKSLKNFGYEISIDDYGVAYSNHSRINQIQPNEIKIDRSIIQKLDWSVESLLVIKKLIEHTQHYNTRLICEGIEHSKIRHILENFNLFLYQGYLYSKPILPEDAAILASNQVDTDNPLLRTTSWWNRNINHA